MAKIKDVTANAWLLTVVSAIVIASLTRNVSALDDARDADQREYRAGFAAARTEREEETKQREKLEAEFTRTVQIIDEWRRDVDMHRATVDEKLRAMDGGG